MNEILNVYRKLKPKIEEKLNGFRELWQNKDQRRIFKELLFCLLTPQSKAENAWEAIENLERENHLFKSEENTLKNYLKKVRFKNKKAKYVRKAQDLFVENGKIRIVDRLNELKDPFVIREWLVENVMGMGYKEASHFLRNIGLGENLTILDRHILRALKRYGYLDQVPNSISKKKYIEIERKMKRWAQTLNIPISHLDFVIWQIESNRIFK